MPQHPFAGRRGAQVRMHHARRLFVSQLGQCPMCGQSISPTLKGKHRMDSAVVDHIRPIRLRPDLAHDEDNLWLVCKSCHGHCDSIEKAHEPDDQRIADEKASACWDGW